MVDVTSICNQALAAIGTRTTISSIAEQSNEARQCLLQYEPTRRHLLRAAHWGFARAYWAPPLAKTHRSTPEFPYSPGTITLRPQWDERFEPPPPWLYAYDISNEQVLAVRYVLPTQVQTPTPVDPIFGTITQASWIGTPVKFETAVIQLWMSDGSFFSSYAKGLLTNMPQALMCFTRSVEDPNLFDESFTRAFVQGLAANICQALTGDLKLLDALVKMTNNLILDARVKSANEGLNAIDIMPDWFRVRGLGPSIGTGSTVAEYGPMFGGVG